MCTPPIGSLCRKPVWRSSVPGDFGCFFEKRAAEGPFELYTDVESTIEHYDKIRKMFKGIIILELVCLLLEAVSAILGKIPIAWGGACLILAVILAMVKEFIRLNEIIAELKGRRGEPDGRRRGDRPLTRALLIGIAIGMLVSSIALFVQNPLYEIWKHGRILIGLLLVGAGLILAVRKRD